VYAELLHVHYTTFVPRARAGEFGPLIRIGERTFGLRYGDWKAAMTAREVVK
jgi:hypothetical protein